MAAGNDVYNPEEGLENLRRSFTSIYMTLVSIIQGAVLSYLVVVVADNFRGFDLARWLMAVVDFLMVVAIWQEDVMSAHSIGGVFRYRDSFFAFIIGAAQFMMIRAIVPDVATSFWFFFSVLFMLIGVTAYGNQYRSIQTKGPHQDVLNAVKAQIRLKAIFLFIGAISALAFGLLVLFFHDSRLIVALVAVSLLMQINTLRQEAGSWNRIFRYSKNDEVTVDNVSQKQK